MKLRTYARSGAIVAAIALTFSGLAACGSSSESGADGTKSIMIGVSGPYTGPSAAFGPLIENGLKTGFKDNGSDGVQFKLVSKDDACSPEKAVTVVQGFLTSDLNATFGPGCSGALSATQKMMASAKMVHISGGYQATLTKNDDGYYFRTVPNDTQLTSAMADYISELGHKKLALVHDDTSYGTSGADEFTKNAESRGLDVTYNGEYKYGSTDFSGQVVRIRDAKPDAIVLQGYEGDLGQLVKQIRKLGLKQPIFGPTAMGNPEFVAAAGAAANGVVFTSNYVRGNPETADFSKKFKDTYKMDLTDVAAAAYLGGVAFAEAFKTLDSDASGDVLVKTIRGLDIQTPLGRISFDDKGDLTHPPILIGTVKDGKTELVKDLSKK